MRFSHFFLVLIVGFSLLSFESQAQTTITISFKVTIPKNYLKGIKTVELRGSVEPLSWEQPTLLTKANDSVFYQEITFLGSERVLEYKYVINGKNWENLEFNRIASVNTGYSSIDKFNKPEVYYPQQFRLIPKGTISKDFGLFGNALPDLHAGFKRYTNESEFKSKLNEQLKTLPNLLNEAQLYLAVSQLAATIKCGHTYANFYNQNAVIHHLVFNKPDKLPFTLHITDKQIFVVKNLSNLKGIEPGSEIQNINGVPASEIIATLLSIVKADGDNNGKRISDLQLTGLGKYEAFDIYFPLLFPSKNDNKYEVQILPYNKSNYITTDVETISRDTRKQLLQKNYNIKELPADSLFQFKLINEEKTAYLKLGTFNEFQLKLDWKKFLANSFKIIEKKKIQSLIIDIRNNEGGQDNIPIELLTYLIVNPIKLEKSIDLVRYQKMKPMYTKFIDTWDKSVFNFTSKTEPYQPGYFRLLNTENILAQLKAKKKLFRGNTILLVNEANSSGTFLMAKMAQYNKLATLIGTETGGDVRGINAGIIGFLRLPNSNIEVDIPLIGTYYSEDKQGGIIPDVKVSLPFLPFLYPKDYYINTALEFINKK